MLESKSQPETTSQDINFFQGKSDYFEKNDLKDKGFSEKENAVKAKILEFFNMKNVCFLLGSGTSCPAIPCMSGLYKKVKKKIEGTKSRKFFDDIAKSDYAKCVNKDIGKNEKTEKNEKVEEDEKNNNIKKNGKDKKDLEQILGVLYSGRSFFNGFDQKYINCYEKCNELIKSIEEEIFKAININFDTDKQKKVLETYKNFYQKIALRNKDLSRICVFTTNNDLYNEQAMDSLNIHYVNGFTGGLTKHFNPAMFNYTYSKRMDISIDKYEPVENMVYLYKIHGSVNWADKGEDENNFFSIVEEKNSKWADDKNILIYPTPTKQNKSLGAPYVDLFREFQHRLLNPNTVLFVMGYGFNDEHVNDIIYRALATNTTFNLVIINELSKDKPVCKIDDKRIFRLWGDCQKKAPDAKIHYFDYFVKNLLPDLNAFTHEQKVLEDFVSGLKKITKTGNGMNNPTNA